MTPASIDVPDTFADLLHNLGDVPPHRVLWRSYPATEDDVVRLADGEPKRLCELVDGVLVEKAMGFRESLFATILGAYVVEFVRPRRLGIVAGADALMRLFPGIVRIPDLAFTAWKNLPAPTAHLKPVAHFTPDLAVEVISDSNTKAEIDRKIGEYFRSGSKLVWVFDPNKDATEVYTSAEDVVRLAPTDVLSGDPVLPGFRLSLAELFADPQLNPRPE
ncbi:MAG TPA: Uma2 family endonuclease [Fimbriiglobus sp.]